MKGYFTVCMYVLIWNTSYTYVYMYITIDTYMFFIHYVINEYIAHLKVHTQGVRKILHDSKVFKFWMIYII